MYIVNNMRSLTKYNSFDTDDMANRLENCLRMTNIIRKSEFYVYVNPRLNALSYSRSIQLMIYVQQRVTLNRIYYISTIN